MRPWLPSTIESIVKNTCKYVGKYNTTSIQNTNSRNQLEYSLRYSSLGHKYLFVLYLSLQEDFIPRSVRMFLLFILPSILSPLSMIFLLFILFSILFPLLMILLLFICPSISITAGQVLGHITSHNILNTRLDPRICNCFSVCQENCHLDEI